MSTESQPNTDRDPFFVGWLTMPRSYSRFLLPVSCVLLAVAVLAGVVIALGQRSPGTGVWDDNATTFTGVVSAEPYAMIRVSGETNGTPRTVLLVNEGKFGAKDRVRPHDGKAVRVRGTLLSRDGRTMLELADGDEGLTAAELPEAEQRALRRPAAKPLGEVTIRGELVDSKCYLGAMKPGGGRTHKGCAVLCLKGGIPPVFVARDDGDRLFLLTNAEGGPLSAAYFDLAADSIRLVGHLEEWGDLRVLKVARRVGIGGGT